MNNTGTSSAKTTEIKFNQGRALLHLAGMYPSLMDVVLELVQNALDKDVQATKIWIVINYMTRSLFVRDNGAGSSIARFNAALSSVAEPGRKGNDSLGQFGIGLISPLGKCERFTFTSCPTPHKNLFQEWTFETARVVAQREGITIPIRPRTDLTLDESSVGKSCAIVKWRSEVAMFKFTEDEFVSRVNLDHLIGGIQDRYAAVMRRNKVVISLTMIDKDGLKDERPNVTAQEFRGRKLPELTLNEGEHRVKFRMFVSPKTSRGRVGRVLMGVAGNDFRFPFHFFARSCVDLLDEAVVTALTSGLFEGEITTTHAKLHPNRKTFERDDAHLELCVLIETWFREHGKDHLDEARQCRQEERFQELGLRSMKVLDSLLDMPEHKALKGVIAGFNQGTVGVGHSSVAGKKAIGEQADKSLSLSGGSGSTREPSSESDERARNTAPEHKPGHTPLTVSGPRGLKRKVVRGHSQGLGFSYEVMEGSPDLWKLDVEMGVLRFNIRHPLWMSCDDKSDASLMKLQEIVAIQALTLHMMPENLRDCQRKVLDELTNSMVSWILKGDRARGTQSGGSKKKKSTPKT